MSWFFVVFLAFWNVVQTKPVSNADIDSSLDFQLDPETANTNNVVVSTDSDQTLDSDCLTTVPSTNDLADDDLSSADTFNLKRRSDPAMCPPNLHQKPKDDYKEDCPSALYGVKQTSVTCAGPEVWSPLLFWVGNCEKGVSFLFFFWNSNF